jgi:hypothetical protein
LLTGALYYNTTTQTMKVYDGANWITATAAGTTALLTYKYVATAGQTTFSGAASVGGTLSYTSNNIIVFVNGVSLDSTDYTATNGTSVVLASGAALNDEVVIVAFKSFTVADTYTKGEVDAFSVKLTGAQTVAGVKTFSSQPVFSAGIDLSSNGQVKFPATQSASTDANTLDDYEEGSFTPVMTGSSSGTFNGYGQYVKVGKSVTVQIQFEGVQSSSISGNVNIASLPFTIANSTTPTTDLYYGGVATYGVNAAGGQLYLFCNGNTTSVEVYYTKNDGTASTQLSNTAFNASAGNSYLRFAMTYIATA